MVNISETRNKNNIPGAFYQKKDELDSNDMISDIYEDLP